MIEPSSKFIARHLALPESTPSLGFVAKHDQVGEREILAHSPAGLDHPPYSA